MVFTGGRYTGARVARRRSRAKANWDMSGYVLVQQYQNGFYHTSKPIRSAVLNDYSRRAANMAADDYGEPQWHETYRMGEIMHTLNFLHSFENE